MDFPHSVPGVGLVSGRFVDEDAVNNRIGSLIPSAWGNAITDEMLNVIKGAGISPSEADHDQLFTAIRNLIDEGIRSINGILEVSVNDVPISNEGAIYVMEHDDIWTWRVTPFFTGYRSPRCGSFEWGTTSVAEPWQVDAVGQMLQKSEYRGLWACAQENGLVVSQANWGAGRLCYSDVGGDKFRVPDLSNMFVRATGTNADTATARLIGSSQAYRTQTHTHGVNGTTAIGGTGGTQGNAFKSTGSALGVANLGDPLFTVTSLATGGAETRPVNVALHPRLHI